MGVTASGSHSPVTAKADGRGRGGGKGGQKAEKGGKGGEWSNVVQAGPIYAGKLFSIRIGVGDFEPWAGFDVRKM